VTKPTTAFRREPGEQPEHEARGIGRADLLIACSSGGHLLQMLQLRDAWSGFSRLWVSDDTTDVRSLLADEPLVLAHGPTTRNLGSLARNVLLAWRVCRKARPRVVLTTGAGTAVPFAWVGRLHGARVVYVESLTRVESPSLSFRLVQPVASRVYVQWPELAQRIRGARYVGTVLGRR
jgi:UDP-N-acetylglucosamine:LPS N-acetylglucosamine transferase